MANLLVVDDDTDLGRLLQTALERDGHRVEVKTSGGQLTEALCRWADCILLDVMMPDEDGFAVCRRIRNQTDAPILFLSARTDEPAVLGGAGHRSGRLPCKTLPHCGTPGKGVGASAAAEPDALAPHSSGRRGV